MLIICRNCSKIVSCQLYIKEKIGFEPSEFRAHYFFCEKESIWHLFFPISWLSLLVRFNCEAENLTEPNFTKQLTSKVAPPAHNKEKGKTEPIVYFYLIFYLLTLTTLIFCFKDLNHYFHFQGESSVPLFSFTRWVFCSIIFIYKVSLLFHYFHLQDVFAVPRTL